MNNNGLKYNCFFGGGAVRGAAYAGVALAMEELRIQPENFIGSSVGAVVATLLAIGYNAKELNSIFAEVNFALFKDIQLGINSKFALSKGGIFLNWIRNLIEKKYYGNNYKKGKNKPVYFKDIDKNLLIITTDIKNFKPKEFSKSETPECEIALAVKISCSMPGLLKPADYNGTKLVDGDLLKSVPMWKLTKSLEHSHTRCLEFRLEGSTCDKNPNAIEFVNAVYTCMTNASATFINELYCRNDMYDCISINTGDVILVDFNCSQEKRELLTNYGYKQTMDYFTNYLPDKKKNLLQKYLTVESIIKNATSLIKSKKILKAKSVLGEIFIYLFSCQDELDENIITMLKDFYTLFCNSIKYPTLFGIVTVQDPKKIMQQIDILQENISVKISELNMYINKFNLTTDYV